jgi:hypothetical protein
VFVKKGGTRLYELEAWQEWRKEQRQRVIKLYSENLISEDEMKDRFEAIDIEYNEGIKSLKTKVNIFSE